MRRNIRTFPACSLGIVIVAGLWLAGCATPQPPTEAELNTEMPNRVRVTFEKRSLAVHFAPGSEAPDAAQISAMNVLLATGDLGRGDTVRIDYPDGPLAKARAAMLSAALAREGLVPTINLAPAVPADQLRLELDHAVASVPNCPNWSDAPGNPMTNALHSDFGCTTALNLAAMVADPHDLIAGRPMGPAVGDRALAAIHVYRTGKPKSSDAPPANGATLSIAPAASAP